MLNRYLKLFFFLIFSKQGHHRQTEVGHFTYLRPLLSVKVVSRRDLTLAAEATAHRARTIKTFMIMIWCGESTQNCHSFIPRLTLLALLFNSMIVLAPCEALNGGLGQEVSCGSRE